MRNEMGNNNTSEFREDETAKAEGPENSLLEGGVNEVEADEVEGLLQKEARPSSGEVERVNGDHHVTEKEEEKNKACNIEELQVVSEKLPDRPKEDNEVEVKSKGDQEMAFELEENRSDGNEHEHEKLASNQKEEEGESGSNLNKTVLSLDEPKHEKTTEQCKDALGSLNNTYRSADYAMPDSDENTNMDQVIVIDTDRDTNMENDGEKGKVSNSDMITYASEDEKSEKTSDFNIDQLIDNDGDTNQENDEERGKGSNFNTITHALKDQKSEMNSDIDTDQVIDTDVDAYEENDDERRKDSNFGLMNASEDPKSEMNSDFDTDQVIDIDVNACKEDDEERRKGSNFGTINASEDPISEKTSNLDTDQVVHTDPDTDKGNDEEMGNGSNFDTLIHTSKDSENSSDLKTIQHESPETNAESLTGQSDDGTTDMEKKKGEQLEPKPCHGYTMAAAKNVDTKDDHEGTTTDSICRDSSCSLAEEKLVIESPTSSMQVPEIDDRCTVLKEESQLREERLGTETVVQNNIPTQSKIPNGVQEEFNTIGSHSENNAEETEVSPQFVAKNENKAPVEDCEDSDGEYLEISEQGMDMFNLSIGDFKHKNEEMGGTTEISTNNEHEAERREPDEILFEPVLGFQPQIQQMETSITFQNAESTDDSISAKRQETDTSTEKSKNNPSNSPGNVQTASETLTETKRLPNSIDEQSLTTLPFSTFGGEDQESPGRTSNESISENSIGHIEMRKSPSFNIDIQSEGKAGETEKTPLLYQIKTIENLPNLQEISFPNPMEKRVVKLGRSDSEKSRHSFLGFAKENEESGMESKAMDQNNFVAEKKAAKDLPPPSPIRKGKRRTKSLIFGTCICCATAIN